jgi:hypothetical protein
MSTQNIDPTLEGHFKNRVAFQRLLRKLGYDFQETDDGLVIRLPTVGESVKAFDLHGYIDRAMGSELFNAMTWGEKPENQQFEIALALEPDQIHDEETVLGQSQNRFTQYKEYFLNMPLTMERLYLSFDFDDPPGIALTSHLMNYAVLYVDYENTCGPEEALEDFTLGLFPERWIAYEALSELDLDHPDKDTTENDEQASVMYDQLWLTYLDCEFDVYNEIGGDEDYTMIICNTPSDKGYEDDVMFFILDKSVIPNLKIPPSYRYVLN